MKAITLWKNPLVTDPLLAFAATHAILFPIFWYIEGSGAFAHDPFVEYALRPLAAYLSLMGLAAGLLGGFFRKRSLRSEQALRELLQERESLLRLLAHDLAGSVGGSRSMVSVLRRRERASGREDSPHLECIETALGGALDMLGLARRLLALESGKMRLDAQPTDLERMLGELARLHAFQAQAKDVRLSLDIEPGCRQAMAEPVSLSGCVLSNLVGNAVKFALPGGEVRLALRQTGNCLRVDVTNLARPVREDRADLLFSFDAATSTTGTAGETGTGFGLPLARRFARLMGGDVRFSQVPAGEDLASIRFSAIVPAATVQAAHSRPGLSVVRKMAARAA